MTHNVHACVAKAIIFHVAVDGGESDEERYLEAQFGLETPDGGDTTLPSVAPSEILSITTAAPMSATSELTHYAPELSTSARTASSVKSEENEPSLGTVKNRNLPQVQESFGFGEPGRPWNVEGMS